MSIFYMLFLCLAVSMDAFAAGLAYGVRNITMPFRSLSIVGIVTAVCTAAAMIAAYVLGQFVELQSAVIAGAILLIVLGALSLFQEYLTKDVPSYPTQEEFTPRKISFPIGKLVISIMARPETADVDNSKSISSFEAIFLGLALGLDNMVATFAACLMGILPWYTPLAMGVVQMALIAAGCWASTRLLSESMKKRFPFVPGAILIMMGLLRLR